MSTNSTITEDSDTPRNPSLAPGSSNPKRAPPVTVPLTFNTIGPKPAPSASDRYDKPPLDFFNSTKIPFDPNDTAYASFMQILHTRMQSLKLSYDPEYVEVNIKAKIRDSWSVFEKHSVSINVENWESVLENARKGSLRGFEVFSEYRM